MKPEKESDQYKTLAVIITGFTVIFALFATKWALLVAIIVGVAGLISANLLKWIVKAWDYLTQIMSKIIPNILLTTIFYIFLTPIAVLSKIFGHSDPLMLKNTSSSMFVDYNKEIKKSDFEKPW